MLHEVANQEEEGAFDPNFSKIITQAVEDVKHRGDEVEEAKEVEFDEKELIKDEEIEWPCGFCQKRFTAVDLLRLHHKEAHREEKMVKKRVFQCQQCPRFFKGMKSFVKHKDMHLEENKCEKCDKTFKNAIGLKGRIQAHMKTHSNENVFAISRNQELIMDVKHPEKTMAEIPIVMEGLPMIIEDDSNDVAVGVISEEIVPVGVLTKETWYDEEWACGLCPKRFTGENFLTGHHQRKHGEELQKSKKVFACRECPKSFAILKNMESHRTTHSMPTKCDQCNVEFTNMEALREHMKVHTRVVDSMDTWTNSVPSIDAPLNGLKL